MADTYEVIKYVKIHFDKSWTSDILPSAVMKYTAAKEARLKVVSEGDAGLWSYDFSLKPNEVVYVIGEVVHIPAQYVGKQNGNTF